VTASAGPFGRGEEARTVTRLIVGAPLIPLRTGVIEIAHGPALVRRILHVAARLLDAVFVVTRQEPLTFPAARGAMRVVRGAALIV